MSDKILTVIVPTYNMEKYLPKCLGSLVIAPELMEKLEVLVVNDGSRDRTSRIAHGFEDMYPQVIKVIDKENGQYGSCVNCGLMVAHGTFVKILDADDSFDAMQFQDFVAALVRIEESSPGYYDLAVSMYDAVDETGELLNSNRWQWETERALTLEDLSPYFGKIYLYHLTYRTSNLRKMGYRQTEGIYYTDMEWITWPMATVKNVYYTPLVVYRYLVGRPGQSVAREVRVKHADAYATIFLNSSDTWRTVSPGLVGSQRRYLEGQLRQMASLAYGILVFDVPLSDAVSKIRYLMEKTRGMDGALLQIANSSVMLFANSLRIPVMELSKLLGVRLSLLVSRAYKGIRCRMRQ